MGKCIISQVFCNVLIQSADVAHILCVIGLGNGTDFGHTQD
jgi:hypothetical protein